MRSSVIHEVYHFCRLKRTTYLCAVPKKKTETVKKGNSAMIQFWSEPLSRAVRTRRRSGKFSPRSGTAMSRDRRETPHGRSRKLLRVWRAVRIKNAGSGLPFPRRLERVLRIRLSQGHRDSSRAQTRFVGNALCEKQAGIAGTENLSNVRVRGKSRLPTNSSDV